MKKVLTIGIIAAIIIAIGLLMYFSSSSKVCGASNGEIDVHFYDANGNPICKIETLSTVGLTSSTGAKGVSYITLTTKATNEASSVPLSCNIYKAQVNGAAGTVFDTAMTRTEKFLATGQTIEWTSNLFLVSGFESAPTPDIFNVTIRCYASGNPSPLDGSGSVQIYIAADGTGSFTVEITPPEGIPALYCGDGTCSSGETLSNCPQDCGVSSNVKFRTTDLTYVQGSAIAVNIGTCGNILTKYGYDSVVCRAETDASCPTITGYTKLFSNSTIPDSITTWSTIAPCLYQTSAGMSVLFKVAAAEAPTTCASPKWLELKYTTGSSYASSISNQATSFNSAKEISC